MNPSRRLALLVSAFLVGWLAAGARAAPPDAAARPDLEKQVRALVRQLGDDEFRQREAAYQALLRLGADVLPIIDRLGPQDDAEVRSRLRQVRRELAAYLEDIYTGLEAMPEIRDEVKPPLPDGLKQFVEAHQPRAGDFLLGLIANPKEPLHRRAVNAFLQTWESMSAAQIETYLRHALDLRAVHRDRYPQGIDAAFSLQYVSAYGWGGWPSQLQPRFVTRTTHLLDGKPYGKPFAYQGPMATTGWIHPKDLSLGKHTCGLEVEYELTHQGKTLTGLLRSREFTFTVVAADTPDDLVAPADADTDRLVRGALRFAERQSDFNQEPPDLNRFPLPAKEERRPQITWRTAAGERGGLATVLWNVAAPLPVDLAFEVALHDQKTGKVYSCSPLVLRRGEKQWGYVSPDDVVGFCRGRSGDVAVKVVLTPSRKVALTATEVTRYYPGSITSDVLNIKVFDKLAEPMPREEK